MAKRNVRERDLYQPVSTYLSSRGYKVRGEVKDCDVVAVRDDEIIVVELKRTMGLDIVLQAVDRQRTTDSVYVALPADSTGKSRTRWRRFRRLLRRLELGLMLVDFRPSGARAEVIHHPKPYDRRTDKRKQRSVIREFEARTGDRNDGGSSAGKRMTAYRENAIHIACALSVEGTASPARLRELGTGEKTQRILANNVYGWFVRESRGVYGLHTAGKSALDQYPEVAGFYMNALRSSDNPESDER